MKDLSMYSFGKVGNGSAIHIIFDGKSLCNSREGAGDSAMTIKDVNCRRCINPMHKYKPYKDLMAAAKKSAK
jgi:hypothetical protein